MEAVPAALHPRRESPQPLDEHAAFAGSSTWTPRAAPARSSASTPLDDRASTTGPGSSSAAGRSPAPTPRSPSRAAQALGRARPRLGCWTTSSRADFPFLGACYGIGSLGRHQGAARGPQLPRAGRAAVSVDADRRRAGGPAVRRRTARLPRRTAATRRRSAWLPGARRTAGDLGGCAGAGVPGRATTSTRPSSTRSSISPASSPAIAVYATYGYFDPTEQPRPSHAAAAAVDGEPPDDDPAQLPGADRAVAALGLRFGTNAASARYVRLVTRPPRGSGCPSVQTPCRTQGRMHSDGSTQEGRVPGCRACRCRWCVQRERRRRGARGAGRAT